VQFKCATNRPVSFTTTTTSSSSASSSSLASVASRSQRPAAVHYTPQRIAPPTLSPLPTVPLPTQLSSVSFSVPTPTASKLQSQPPHRHDALRSPHAPIRVRVCVRVSARACLHVPCIRVCSVQKTSSCVGVGSECEFWWVGGRVWVWVGGCVHAVDERHQNIIETLSVL
jgi:hypothetical protein